MGLRVTLFLLSAFLVGLALGVVGRGLFRPGTMNDIRGNESYTRKGAFACLMLSFVVFLVAVFAPAIATLADKYITGLLALSGGTFTGGKFSEEIGSAIKKFTGGGDAPK